MGPPAAAEALRKALSIGGDRGVHVSDPALHGSDAHATSLVLARAIERIGYDIVVCGMASTDAGMGTVPAMLAERLGIPQVSLATRLSLDGDQVTIDRETQQATETLQATLPALVSVTDRTREARCPSFKGIMAAKKKPVETWSLADLGIDGQLAGLAHAYTKVLSATARPPRAGGEIATDDDGSGGSGGERLLTFLGAQKFILGRVLSMTSVLIVAEVTGATVPKSITELLTLARRLGEPVTVALGTGAAGSVDALARYGAARVCIVDDPLLDDYSVLPQTEAVAQVAATLRDSGGGLAAVLVPATPEGKELAARLAVRLDGGLITDATDVEPGGAAGGEPGSVVTTQSVFAGSYSVKATVTRRTPVIAVKANAVAPEPAPVTPEVEKPQITFSDQASAARVTARAERAARAGRRDRRRVRWPRSRRVRGVRARRAPRRPARRGRRSLAGGGRRGLVPAQQPGGPDRQDRISAALRGDRHIRGYPAPGRHADLEGDRRG